MGALFSSADQLPIRQQVNNMVFATTTNMNDTGLDIPLPVLIPLLPAIWAAQGGKNAIKYAKCEMNPTNYEYTTDCPAVGKWKAAQWKAGKNIEFTDHWVVKK